MAQLRIERVNALPLVLTPSTLYFVRASEADLLDLYMTGTDEAEVRHIISKTEISNMIAAAISGTNGIILVNDITERDALSLSANSFVLVLDATDDPTVSSGAALYFYDFVNTTWYKVSEFESLDVTLEWSAINGRPTSSPAQIDLAVSQRHVHGNMAVLDALSEDAGQLMYSGEPVGNVITTAEW